MKFPEEQMVAHHSSEPPRGDAAAHKQAQHLAWLRAHREEDAERAQLASTIGKDGQMLLRAIDAARDIFWTSESIVCGWIILLGLHTSGFSAAASFGSRNQKVDIVVFIAFRRIHWGFYHKSAQLRNS